MNRAAEAADRAVWDLQERTGGNMKTTMVFLAPEGGKAMWMHVGDSRLYHFQHQIRFHADRNQVLRALGAEDAQATVSPETEIAPGDAFLLCTDGFWEFVYEEEMEQILAEAKDPQAWLDGMLQLLKKRIHQNTDNYTAAAVFCK